MVKQELTDKYYKQNLCDSSCCCKLYNPLLTQGECHYYNEWCELKDKVSDLEAKLAESEEQIWALENQKLHAHNCLNKLKQQLAEKEKHYEIIMPARQNGKSHLFRIKLVEMQNKKAIEQLEKVKDWVDNMLDGWKTNQEVNQLAKDGICLALENVGYKINNQIAELKKEMK